uniref:G-protein coupled receptors family 1 profile domain-containing protein n=1 Tax=Plectus sambesii TaxID=2011161 RepID=A0A914V1W6_9BILA
MSQANVTLTFEQMYGHALRAYVLYWVIGGIAIFTNIIIVIIFSSSSLLRVKYQLLIALAIGDLINGVAFVFSGVTKQRIILSMTSKTVMMWPAWSCTTESYPGLLILGAQWPACVTLLLGLERFAAVHFPIWYKVNINGKARFKMVVFSVVFSLVSLGVAFAQSYIFFGKNYAYSLCTISGAFGKYYTTWNYIVTVFVHLFAFGLNASAFLSAYSKSRLTKSGLNTVVSKEIALVRLMLSISFVSTLLISIPNIILWGQSWFWNIGGNPLGYLYVSFCASSVINIIIYIFFNREFRTQLFRSIPSGLLSKPAVGNVDPITTPNMAVSANKRAGVAHGNSSIILHS